jgi:Rhs element Vgr protein
MAASNNISTGAIATFKIKANGNEIPDTIQVHSVFIEKKVNRIANAKITVLDGDASTGSFEASSSATFVPGTIITIEAGYDGTNRRVFEGVITSQSLRIDSLVGSALEIECRDSAVKMIVGRKSHTYSNKKDSEIISSVIGNYTELTSDVSVTNTIWPKQVQHYVTDWDYIVSLAEANGLIVTTINGKVSVFNPGSNPAPVLTITYGDSLLEFNARLNAITQLGNVTSNSWDYKVQKVIGSEAMPDISGPGNLSSKKLSEVVGLSSYQLQTSASLETSNLSDWAKAQIIKSEYSKIIGEAKIQGSGLVEPGNYISFQGVGDRFNGDHFVSGVTHDLSQGNWLTEVTFGLSPLWFTEEPDVMSPPASGLIPGARGLFNGTVKQMFDDPDSQYRVLVDIPLLDAKGEGIWARLSNFYSTNGAGAFFLPEVEDEVIIGFLNEDPRYPVILGSLYSSPNTKPSTGFEPNGKNTKKGIVSKSGISVEFDDENKTWTVATPNKNTIIISDRDKNITIKDESQNSIIMSQNGIAMTSPKNITIAADEKVIIKGIQGVSLQSNGGDVDVRGLNIRETADDQYSASGGQMAKITSELELKLKSALIMIN